MTYSAFTWMRAVYGCTEARRLSATHAAVVILLLDYADYSTGENARPTVPTLARRTGLGERAVRYALKAGVKVGVLVEGPRGGGQGDSARGTTYRLTIPNSGTELPQLPSTNSGKVVPQLIDSGTNFGTNSGTGVPTTEPPSYRATSGSSSSGTSSLPPPRRGAGDEKRFGQVLDLMADHGIDADEYHQLMTWLAENQGARHPERFLLGRDEPGQLLRWFAGRREREQRESDDRAARSRLRARVIEVWPGTNEFTFEPGEVGEAWGAVRRIGQEGGLQLTLDEAVATVERAIAEYQQRVSETRTDCEALVRDHLGGVEIEEEVG